MPFAFDHSEICPSCPYGLCFEDLRDHPVRGRTTKFRLSQEHAMNCTFDAFIPGTETDPDPTRSFSEYLSKFRENVLQAGRLLKGSKFDLTGSAIAKVEGDILELLEAAALWNACAAWNRFMDSNVWSSTTFVSPEGAIATPSRKVAIIKLPRGYDALKLFRTEIRGAILAHEQALQRRDMELGLSSPDIVGVRLPHPLPPALERFLVPLENLGASCFETLANSYKALEGSLTGPDFLLAIAVKKSTRSDRLYQPLFEANILKYLIEVVLRGAAFRFYAHLMTFEGANVKRHYKAASLISLIRGGTPQRAIDSLYLAHGPRDAAQSILNDLPLFPV